MRPGVEPFEICKERVEPGTRQRFELPVARLYTQQFLSINVIVVHGVRPGPRLWLSAAIHGDELVGIEAIRDALAAVEPDALAGTIIAVPIVNQFGLISQSRYLPDRRDLNRSFPGSSRGSLAARMAHMFMSEIVAKATHGIDIHTAAIHNANLPQVRANLADPATRRLARAFGAPVMIHANERDGSLRAAASKLGLPSLLFEGGRALRRDPDVVQAASSGILRVMRAIGMIRATALPPIPRPPAPLVSFESRWVRAPRSGFAALSVRLGQRVRAGERLGAIHDGVHPTLAAETSVPIAAPHAGLVIGLCENPLVHRGDALVHIARVGE